MKLLRTASEMRRWSLDQKKADKSIGFAPTMGALHEGHASLLRGAREHNDAAVASIFVNPTQFAPHEDFEDYPRTWEADTKLCQSIGIDAIYAPDAKQMYPPGYQTYVQVMQLTEHLCGRSRPHFFRGVTTVVTKLFNAVLPDRAYFGQKDAQQCAVIRRMTRDLDLGVEIVEMPIIRDEDGLALSSRNKYLTEADRAAALCIPRTLAYIQHLMKNGERSVERFNAVARKNTSDVILDYFEVVDAETMQPVLEVKGKVLVAMAAVVGETRLIDNFKFTPPEHGASRTTS